MREDVSRRKALSLLGTALGLALATAEDAKAETTMTKHHTKHPKRSAVQRASAPAEAAPAEFKPTKSPTDLQSGVGLPGPRPPLHIGEEKQQ
jgi:hypothetical protein